MQIVTSLEDAKALHIQKNLSPVVLTIGNFEGVHLGHQALLKHVVELANHSGKTSTVVTFSNHPSQILRPVQQTNLLTTTDHKLELLENLGIDLVLLLPFTIEFSEQTAEQFLVNISAALPFYSLILGSDAHIGKNREGDRSTIAALATKMGFILDYFEDLNYDGLRISSSRIRNNIEKGDLNGAAKLLGRPYSIYGKVLHGSGRGAEIGFPTANIAVNKLCLPPKGVYAVVLKVKGEQHLGVANLGNAPTLHQERQPMLEVYLFDKTINLYGESIEVIVHHYLRPEKHFESIDALKSQISQDVQDAKNRLKLNLPP